MITTKSKHIAGHNGGLDHGVLLLGEGSNLESQLRESARPQGNEEVGEESSSQVDGRRQAYPQIEVVFDDAEEGP